MFAALQGKFSQTEMGVWRSRECHNIQFRIMHQILSRSISLDSRVIFFCIIIGLGGSLDYGMQPEFRNSQNEGNMKYLCTEAISNHPNAEGFRRHGLQILSELSYP